MANWSDLSTLIDRAYGTQISAANRCRLILLEAITRGHLLPGARLIESEIGDTLAVSRTPLREALSALKAEGIVQNDADGLRIRQLDWRDIHNLYDMRITLESMAAKLAAMRASKAEKAVIDNITQTEQQLIQEQAEAIRLARQNADFHHAILKAAQNSFLEEALAKLSRLLILLGSTAYTLPDRVAQIAHEHRAINAAIQKNNADEAEAAMRIHLENALSARLHLLALSGDQPLNLD